MAARQANRYLWRANAGTKNALAENWRLLHPTTIQGARTGRAITLPLTAIRFGVAADLPRRAIHTPDRVATCTVAPETKPLREIPPLLKSRPGFYFSGLVNPSPCQSLAKSSVSASSTIGLQGLANDAFGPDPLSPFTGIVDSASERQGPRRGTGAIPGADPRVSKLGRRGGRMTDIYRTGVEWVNSHSPFQ